MRAIGYVRVSTDEQAAHGHGLAAQRTAIRNACEARGWELVEIVGEDRGASGKSLDRAGLLSVLDRLDHHQADALVVQKLDRLSRSLADGAAVIERAQRRGWDVVALDMGVDTSSPSGELLAGVLLTAARFERRMASERTKAGLAAAVAEKGVTLGRPATLDAKIVRRIVTERRAGRSLPAIASGLNSDGVATAQGGHQWWPSTVAAVLRSRAAREVADEPPKRARRRAPAAR